MHCWNCGAKNLDGYQRCVECRARARKPSLLGRLFGFLFSGAVKVTFRPSTDFRTTTITARRKGGESLENLPPEMRAKLEEALASGSGPRVHTSESVTFTFEDASGRKRTYHSVDDMPPDVRAIYERLREEHG